MPGLYMLNTLKITCITWAKTQERRGLKRKKEVFLIKFSVENQRKMKATLNTNCLIPINQTLYRSAETHGM